MQSEIIEPASNECVVIRTRRAQVGDVVLTLGRSVFSSAIASATAGKFSHAALWTGSALYEAMIGRGIGAIALKPVTLRTRERAELLHTPLDDQIGLQALPRARRYLLLRHPDVFSKHEPQELEELLLTTDLFKQFSGMPALLAALPPQAAAWRAAGQPVCRVAARVGLMRGVRGPFCSMLVARFFERAKVDLFDPPRCAGSVHPSLLLESRLQPKAGVLCSYPRERLKPVPADAHATAIARNLSPERVKRAVKRLAKTAELLRRQEAVMSRTPRSIRERCAQTRKVLRLTERITDLQRQELEELQEQQTAVGDLLSDIREDPEFAQVVREGSIPFSMTLTVSESAGPSGAELKESDAVARFVPIGTTVATHLQPGDWWRVRLPDGSEGYLARRLLS